MSVAAAEEIVDEPMRLPVPDDSAGDRSAARWCRVRALIRQESALRYAVLRGGCLTQGHCDSRYQRAAIHLQIITPSPIALRSRVRDHSRLRATQLSQISHDQMLASDALMRKHFLCSSFDSDQMTKTRLVGCASAGAGRSIVNRRASANSCVPSHAMKAPGRVPVYSALKMSLTRSFARPKPAPMPRPDMTLLMNPPPPPP